MTPVLHGLPRWAPMVGTTFGTRRHIWLRAGASTAALEHEKVHLVQVERVGAWRFRLGYLFSRARRREYEAEAYAASVRNGGTIEACARSLSSWLYLWPCTRPEAEAAIRRWL